MTCRNCLKIAGTALVIGYLGLAPACASITDVIDHARTVLYAVIPNPTPPVIQALLNAKNRGVHMGLIVSPASAIQRKLHRFGVHVWVGEPDTTPFVSADNRQVFVYGQTDTSPQEAENYGKKFMDMVLGVWAGQDSQKPASPITRCGVPTAWICRHLPGSEPDVNASAGKPAQ